MSSNLSQLSVFLLFADFTPRCHWVSNDASTAWACDAQCWPAIPATAAAATTTLAATAINSDGNGDANDDHISSAGSTSGESSRQQPAAAFVADLVVQCVLYAADSGCQPVSGIGTGNPEGRLDGPHGQGREAVLLQVSRCDGVLPTVYFK